MRYSWLLCLFSGQLHAECQAEGLGCTKSSNGVICDVVFYQANQDYLSQSLLIAVFDVDVYSEWAIARLLHAQDFSMSDSQGVEEYFKRIEYYCDIVHDEEFEEHVKNIHTKYMHETLYDMLFYYLSIKCKEYYVKMHKVTDYVAVEQKDVVTKPVPIERLSNRVARVSYVKFPCLKLTNESAWMKVRKLIKKPINSTPKPSESEFMKDLWNGNLFEQLHSIVGDQIEKEQALVKEELHAVDCEYAHKYGQRLEAIITGKICMILLVLKLRNYQVFNLSDIFDEEYRWSKLVEHQERAVFSDTVVPKEMFEQLAVLFRQYAADHTAWFEIHESDALAAMFAHSLELERQFMKIMSCEFDFLELS